MAFFLRRKANMREKREEYVYLAYFPVLPLAGGLLQLTMRGMAAIWPFYGGVHGYGLCENAADPDILRPHDRT